MIAVRAYRPGDRSAVRRICHQAGYMGAPADWYWRHAESFADVWTGYYTDQEPESFFVADRDGEVLGYLAGCVDSTRAPSPKAALTRVAVRYALLVRPGTAGFFWRGIRESLGQETPSGELRDPRWPAHLHIDLLPQGRGQGVGTALMNAWFARLRALGVPGCHLSTFAENTAAIRFFERVGFRRHGDRIRTPGMRSPGGEQHHLQYLVRDL